MSFEKIYKKACADCEETREQCFLTIVGVALLAGITGVVIGAASVEPEYLVETKYVLIKDNGVV